jgi:adenine phosphoribosyltransferase
MLLAQELNVGFIPVRKPNKLPYETISASYDLEYGSDTLGNAYRCNSKGDRVLIHDDVLPPGEPLKLFVS